MKVAWEIEDCDVQTVKRLIAAHANDPFVQLRKRRNVEEPRPEISKRLIWKAMVGCLLTTQQRSGPGKPVTKFLNLKPFPLDYEICTQCGDLLSYAQQVLSKFGGIRRSPTIAQQIQESQYQLERGYWPQVLEITGNLNVGSNPHEERHAAHFIAETFSGFGPKQSRNLLQWIGVTKFEIPIDSRVTKWLNRHGFPIALSSGALADGAYYDFVLDGVQELCTRAEIYPCILDAAIFSSFDSGAWQMGNLGSEFLIGD